MVADGLDLAVPLSSLGFDSLMAVQLKNQIENDLGAVVSMIQFLQGPSVDQLTPAILEAVERGAVVSCAGDAPDLDTWEEGSV
jgi:acyl carrier protein